MQVTKYSAVLNSVPVLGQGHKDLGVGWKGLDGQRRGRL
jgi:hypothetical protein